LGIARNVCLGTTSAIGLWLKDLAGEVCRPRPDQSSTRSALATHYVACVHRQNSRLDFLSHSVTAGPYDCLMNEGITPKQFHEADGTEDWRVLGEGACAYFRTGSFAVGARLVQGIAELDNLETHHPDVDLRHDGVTVRLLTASSDWYGMSTRDLKLARRISAVAREQGLTADASAVQSLLVIPGAPDTSAVMPFWQAVLGYDRRPDSPDEDLVDPHDRDPSFWFERMNETRPDGGGAIHVAVWVPHDHAEARVAAALTAGGRMVRDQFAPAWWTLADAAGNEADIATVLTRD